MSAPGALHGAPPGAPQGAGVAEVQADVQAKTQAEALRFEPFSPARIGALLAVECSAHPHPWSAAHFLDAHAAGNYMPLLLRGDTLLGYLVAMAGVDEVHLLNITVAPAHQRQGWAHALLGALGLWAQGIGKPLVWLEVRRSNARAISVYERHGFVHQGERRAYYRAGYGQREDALVMSWPLQGRRFAPEAAWR